MRSLPFRSTTVGNNEPAVDVCIYRMRIVPGISIPHAALVGQMVRGQVAISSRMSTSADQNSALRVRLTRIIMPLMVIG